MSCINVSAFKFKSDRFRPFYQFCCHFSVVLFLHIRKPLRQKRVNKIPFVHDLILSESNACIGHRNNYFYMNNCLQINKI